MAKDYWLIFGSGDPRNNTGLSPTMVIFSTSGGTALTAPGITEVVASSGMYKFTYGVTQSIVFLADGGSVLASGDRWIKGVLDPIQAVDEKVGQSTDSFGSTNTDPSTLWGMAKRVQENLEGDALYTKSTGIWQVYNRGSSTLLREKTLTNTTTSSTKT